MRNRQRTRRIDVRLFRRIAVCLLREHFQRDRYEICVHLVNGAEMAWWNWHYHHQAGATDVLTFDLSEPALLRGEIFISVDEALAAAPRFRATWPAELVRYLIHGLLHLHGFDDTQPAARRRMRKEEDRLLRAVARRFGLRRLSSRPLRTPPGLGVRQSSGALAARRGGTRSGFSDTASARPRKSGRGLPHSKTLRD